MSDKALKGIKDIMPVLRKQDKERFEKATKIICGMSESQARLALHFVNKCLRGYLAMPEKQEGFIAVLERAKKGRD